MNTGGEMNPCQGAAVIAHLELRVCVIDRSIKKDLRSDKRGLE